MNLKGIEFENAFIGSGALAWLQNKFAYWYDFFLFFLPGYNLERATKVARTTTINPNDGNLPHSKKSWRPTEWFPKCIKVFWLKGMVLNVVKLSNPGAKAIFERGHLQKIRKNFVLSFMAIGATREERLEELRQYCILLKKYLPSFLAKIALEINISCPNVGHNTRKLIEEAILYYEIAKDLGIPLILKMNLLATPREIKEIEERAGYDAFHISNTVPYGALAHIINWEKLFGPESPLQKRFNDGGGLSGFFLLKYVVQRIIELRAIGVQTKIIAGLGVSCARNVDLLHNIGANAISLASLKILRPWRTKRTIHRSNQLFGGQKVPKKFYNNLLKTAPN